MPRTTAVPMLNELVLRLGELMDKMEGLGVSPPQIDGGLVYTLRHFDRHRHGQPVMENAITFNAHVDRRLREQFSEGEAAELLKLVWELIPGMHHVLEGEEITPTPMGGLFLSMLLLAPGLDEDGLTARSARALYPDGVDTDSYEDHKCAVVIAIDQLVSAQLISLIDGVYYLTKAGRDQVLSSLGFVPW